MRHFVETTLLSALAATAIGGCANIDIDQAKKLSSAGVTSSTALQAESKAVATRATAWHEGQVFYFKIFNNQIQPPRDELFDRIAKLLRARANSLGEMVAAYKSFQALTDYDASQDTEKASAAFFVATNDFVDKINETRSTNISKLDPGLTEGLNIAFGVIARENQKAKIKKTSVALRSGVAKLSEALKTEQPYQITVRQEIARQRQSISMQALDKNFVSYDKVTRDLLSQFDLELVKDLDPAVRRTPGAQAAIKQIISDRSQAELVGIDKAYTALIGTLDKLVEQHTALEAGKPVDLAEIMKFVGEIEDYYRRIKGAESKTSEPK